MKSMDLGKKIGKILEDKLGKEIKLIQVREFTVLTDYFILATGNSKLHMKAMIEEVEMLLSKENREPHKKEIEAENWMVLDYNDVIVHIFDEESREAYGLDNFWKDAEEIEIN